MNATAYIGSRNKLCDGKNRFLPECIKILAKGKVLSARETYDGRW